MKKNIREKDLEMNNMMIWLDELEQHNIIDSLRIEAIQEDRDDSTNSSVIRIAEDYLGVEVNQSKWCLPLTVCTGRYTTREPYWIP